jgi:endogenous inhibitor of DNA gyrase (YacG/DUF329 family)
MSVVRCPTCGRAFEIEQSKAPPFCSSRCRQIDLGRWLDETNSVPCEPSEDQPPDDHAPSES